MWIKILLKMKNPAARPQGIKFEIRKYTDIRHSCESRNPEKKTGFRITCGMTEIQKPLARLQGITKLNLF